jgi:prepilin-type N-terminal cleavage/methylation domain-containing protein
MERLRTVRAGGRAQGMTLIEVMIATVLLAFGLLAMLALQMHAMRGGRVGRHYTQAAQVARDRMEELHRLPWDHADVQPTAGWVVDPALDSQAQNVTGLTTEQSFTRDYRVVADAANPGELRRIDVRVTWYEASDEPAPAPPIRRYAITTVRFNDGKF